MSTAARTHVTPDQVLGLAEPHPSTHQGPKSLLRDFAEHVARAELFGAPKSDFPRPRGAVSVEDSGAETAIADLMLVEQNRELRETVSRLIDERQGLERALAEQAETVDSLTRQLADADTIIRTQNDEARGLKRQVATHTRLMHTMAAESASFPPVFKPYSLTEPVALEQCGELGRLVMGLSRSYRVFLTFDTAESPDVRPTNVIVSVLTPVEG